MKRCETLLARSGLRHADGSRPCLVRALTRRTPITCMLIWHCTEQVIVIASANVAPRSLTKRFVSVKYRCAQLINVVVRYGEAHPESTHEPFFLIAFIAMHEAWPCK